MRHRDGSASVSSSRGRCDRCGEWMFDADGFCLRCSPSFLRKNGLVFTSSTDRSCCVRAAAQARWCSPVHAACGRCEGLESFDDGTQCCKGVEFDQDLGSLLEDGAGMGLLECGGGDLWGEEEAGREHEEYESPAARRLSGLEADSEDEEDEEGFSEGEEELEVLEEDEVCVQPFRALQLACLWETAVVWGGWGGACSYYVHHRSDSPTPFR